MPSFCTTQTSRVHAALHWTVRFAPLLSLVCFPQQIPAGPVNPSPVCVSRPGNSLHGLLTEWWLLTEHGLHMTVNEFTCSRSLMCFGGLIQLLLSCETSHSNWSQILSDFVEKKEKFKAFSSFASQVIKSPQRKKTQGELIITNQSSEKTTCDPAWSEWF